MAADYNPNENNMKKFQEIFDRMATSDKDTKSDDLQKQSKSDKSPQTESLLKKVIESYSPIGYIEASIDYFNNDATKYADVIAHLNTAIYKAKQIFEKDNKDVYGIAGSK